MKEWSEVRKKRNKNLYNSMCKDILYNATKAKENHRLYAANIMKGYCDQIITSFSMKWYKAL